MKYKITFLSDWVIFNGFNTGEYDNGLLRDTDGFPYIPGKTLKGVFREAYEQIYGILEKEQTELKPPENYFGKTKDKTNGNKNDGLLTFTNAELSDNIREEVNSLSEKDRIFVLGKIGVPVPRIEIDNETNMTKEHSLATLEMGRKGMEFTFSIDYETEEDGNSKKVLELCRKYIGRIGAMRTRGKGKCKIEPVIPVTANISKGA